MCLHSKISQRNKNIFDQFFFSFQWAFFPTTQFLKALRAAKGAMAGSGDDSSPSSAVSLGCIKHDMTSAIHTAVVRGRLALWKSQEYYITTTYVITSCIMPGKRPSVTQLRFLWHFAEMQLLLRDYFVFFSRRLQLNPCRQTGESPALTAALAGEVRDTVMRSHSRARTLAFGQPCSWLQYSEKQKIVT